MTSRQRWIVAAALVTQAFAVGLTHGIYPVFLEPLESEFDAPRTLVAGGQVLMMLSLTGSSLATGLLFDRGHARRVMWGGAALLASALVLAATASNLWVLAVSAILMGVSVPSLGPLSGATLVTRSFAEDRGRALGWIGMGPPLGAGAFAALAAYLMSHSDWRTTLLLFAGAALLVLWPLVWIAVPARFETPREIRPSDGVPAGPDRSLRRPVFWLTAGMFALAAGISTGWTVHFVAFLGGQGLDEAQRAGLLSAQFWLAAPGAFVFGVLGDRLRPERMLVGILAGQGVVLLLYSGVWAPSPLPHALLFVLAIVSGLISGGLIPLFILLLGRRVAPAAFSRALGLANVLMLPALAAAVLASAICFERQGSYQWALIGLGCGQAAAIACLLASNRSAASS